MCVIVITPSLNKSYKFQSDWPYNNSQVYLLSSIYDDLSSDEDRIFESVDGGYLLSSSVNYPNNDSLVKQNIYVDSDLNINKIEVLDENGNVEISMIYEKIEFDKKFDDNYFELSSILNTEESTNNKDTSEENNTTNNEETTNTEETATIEDVIYPMYLPTNTYLTSEQTINTDTGQRLILTFDGDSSFILVEETISYEENSLIIPVYGEMEFLSDVIGIVTDNSITWDSNGVEYYIVSDTIPTSELIEIAKSISVLPVSK